MNRSKKAVIRLVLSAWQARGWRDLDGAALAVVERFREGVGIDEVANAVPQAFLDRNGVARDVVAEELGRILRDVEVDAGGESLSPPPRLKIVFFAANPLDQVQLRLDEEARGVQQRIRASEHRDVMDFATRWAVRPGDLIEALNEERPQIIHFSGHGSASEQLVFQDDYGGTKIVTKEAMAATIKVFSDEVRLVLFNNCYSAAHAEEGARYVEAAIGMDNSISDEAARHFAATFYSALGFGRSVYQAFEQAKAALMLEGIPEEDIPRLFAREDVDPKRLFLVQS